MIISFVAYSSVTGAPLPGISGAFSFAYFKRRNLDGSISTLANPTFVDNGDGAYQFAINDDDLTPGSIISYLISLGASSAEPYTFGHMPADDASVNVVPFFIFSATAGAPISGVAASIVLFKRRNRDGTIDNLIGSAPAVIDLGNLLFVFMVDPSLRSAGAAIEYVIDETPSSASRFVDGVVEDGGFIGPFSSPNPVTPPSQIVPAFAFTADAYADQLGQLLPPGKAFNLEVDSVVNEALEGMAQEFARVDGRAVDLLNESDPRSANETIADWEKMLSLPDDRVLVIAATLAERQIDVTQKYTSRGGQDRQFFIDLAASCGYTVEDVGLTVPAPGFDPQLTTGGSLHNGATVAYRVSAYNAGGETLASAEISRVLSGVTNTNRQQIAWTAIENAIGYKVYGRTSGAELLIATLGAVTSYIDDGSITPSGALPSGSPQPLDYPAIEKFATSIFRAGCRAGAPDNGAAWAYSMLINVQTPTGPAMAQADFERVIRHAVQAHIVAVIFVYH